ncbi:MAG: PIN domain-containing protein [Deltaproteobacteria bacterium]|nr:PIN domain-containing protein [Deltaproteobacteria bacterium]
MIAIDTNLLVYAHREDSAFHTAADRILTELAEGGEHWAIPWPCLHEFVAIVTHPRIYAPPTPLTDAVQQVDCWLESPHVHLLGELPDYWERFRKLATQGNIEGPLVHDARVAAICLQHNVTVLWSADRDFSRFHPLKIKNPLVD